MAPQYRSTATARMPLRLPFSDQEIIARSRTGIRRAEADRVAELVGLTAVSYTHLTLPTICSV